MKFIHAVSAVLTICSPVAWAQPVPKPILPDQSAIVAQCLRHSAIDLINASADTPARADRLVLIADLAKKFDPTSPDTCRLLATIYEIQGRSEKAAEELTTYLAARPADSEQWLRWMYLKLSGLHTSEDRVSFLKGVLADAGLGLSVRSEAAVRLAGIFDRQGERATARQMFRRAASLDAGNPASLTGLLTSGHLDLPETVKILLEHLRASPADLAIAWELARALNSQGLWQESLEVFDYARAIFRARNAQAVLPAELVVEHCSAMLDAGQSTEAAKVFAPLLGEYFGNGDLHALLVEAYKSIGSSDKVAEITRSMVLRYKLAEVRVPRGQDGLLAAELAWFYLFTMSDPVHAMQYARYLTAEQDPVAQRVLGAAELAMGQEAEGVAKLHSLSGRDLYASAFLAEHYFASGDKGKAIAACQTGAQFGRGGPAFRMLRQVAGANGVEIPPPETAQKIAKIYSSADKSFMRLVANPGRYLSVTIHPLSPECVVGEPVLIEAILANTSDMAVPLGDWGIANAVVIPQVSVTGSGEDKFDDLPVMILQAPRYLGPGESVRTTARIDVGKLAKLLAGKPFDNLKIKVTGLLDPIQEGPRLRSALAGVKSIGASMTRPGLLGRADVSSADGVRGAYKLALEQIMRDLRHEDLSARLRAAGKITSLLTCLDRVGAGSVNLPPGLAEVVDKPVILSMLRALLQDSSPVVRAQALVGLKYLRADPAVLALLAPAIEDAHLLVRFRMAEFIGMSGAPGSGLVLEHLGADNSKPVRTMAGLFARSQVKSKSTP